jgi:hypothetical protein
VIETAAYSELRSGAGTNDDAAAVFIAPVFEPVVVVGMALVLEDVTGLVLVTFAFAQVTRELARLVLRLEQLYLVGLTVG